MDSCEEGAGMLADTLHCIEEFYPDGQETWPPRIWGLIAEGIILSCEPDRARVFFGRAREIAGERVAS